MRRWRGVSCSDDGSRPGQGAGTKVHVPDRVLDDLIVYYLREDFFRLVVNAAVSVALYKPWTGNMDEGWTRWLFEQFALPYTNVSD